MASTSGDGPPKLAHDLPDQVPFSVLGKRIVAAAIKGVSHGDAKLRPGRLLLLMMEDGTVAVFDNSDHMISTTGGLNRNGWQGALDYMAQSMNTVHMYRVDEVDGKSKLSGEGLDYL